MTISRDFDERLSFDMADRLRRALRVSDTSVNDMADYLQVSRNTVTAWINGRNIPRRRDLAAFAMRTGFPITWLETGDASPDGPGGNEERPRSGVQGRSLPGLDSNQEPAGFQPRRLLAVAA